MNAQQTATVARYADRGFWITSVDHADGQIVMACIVGGCMQLAYINADGSSAGRW